MSRIAPSLQSATRPQIRVGGRVQDALMRDLDLLQLDEDLFGMKRLAVRFIALGPSAGERHQGLNWMDGTVLDFGSEIDVNLGQSEARTAMFSGAISALELDFDQGRAPELHCLAEDRLMALRLARQFRTWENVDETSLVQDIAARHGLAADVAVEGPVWQTVQQWNQSDLAFLRERARRLGAEVWVEDGTLHMATRDQRDGPTVTLIQGSELLQCRLRADLAHQRGKVVVSGFDDGQQAVIDEEADSATVAAEAHGQTHGLNVLERAFTSPAGLASYRVRDVPLRGNEASALARAALLGRARRFVLASGVASGDTRIRVGARLRLERVGPLFEGDGYYVTRVRHQFDLTDGYRTHFDAERAWIGDSR